MSGTMTELVAASGDVDTSDQLTMAEAFQKCFIANGSKLRIVDFVNTKLTHTALATAHAFGTLLVQDQTGGKYAYMIVDYTTSDKLNTYGYAYYAGGATAFNTANSVTDPASGGGSNFTPSAVTAGPHWRTWLPYLGGDNGDADQDDIGDPYGKLPNKAYLICRYAGRVVLAGNPEEPYQWYMSRLNNPYDWKYTANDAGSPVKGGDADAGQVGDIIRALCPFHDDYLVFGCNSSIWVLFGNPASGGELRNLTDEVGVFGAKSWCYGPDKSLYFMGTNNHFYRAVIPGGVSNLSVKRLPNIAVDDPFAPSTHRVTMCYDKDRHGILISITKLADGTNSNYWYSLQIVDGDEKIGGFHHEDYPPVCAAYSMLYYDADNSSYKGLLVGSTDGYIRKFDNAAKSDDGGAADIAIQSYVGIGPFPMGDGERKEGTLESMDMTVATGINSTGADSDNVTYKVFTARTAADAIKRFIANTAPRIAGLFKGPGNKRGTTRRQPVSGLFGMIRLENNTIAESWSFESLDAKGDIVGRAK